MTPNNYLIGNIVFHKFSNDNFDNIKYIKGSISGQLFLNDIYTEKEILSEFPDAKPCKDLHEICKTWGKK